MKLALTTRRQPAPSAWEKLEARRRQIVRKLQFMGEHDIRRGMLNLLEADERISFVQDENAFDYALEMAADIHQQNLLHPFRTPERHFEIVLRLAAAVERQMQWLEIILDRASEMKPEKEIAKDRQKTVA